MNVLVDTNILRSQHSNPDQHDNIDLPSDDNENNSSILNQIVKWFHLAKRWKEKPPSKVCNLNVV